MKLLYLFFISLILGAAAFSAGCSSPVSAEKTTIPPAETTLPPLPANISYSGHGIKLHPPDSLALTEYDISDVKNGGWESGEIHLKGEYENTSVSWMAMHHRPPDIPVLYQAIRTSFIQDPRMSDVKYYPLATYPGKTCGDATLIGHMSFYDKNLKSTTNEGIIFWYHPVQDRTYIIDSASGKEYDPFIRQTLARYQQSFNCTDT